MKLRSLLFPLTTFVTILMTTAVIANGQCKPGEQIEYKAQNWPEKWEVGTCVKTLPGGSQVLVAEKPNQFYPEGFHRAYDLADVRPVRPVQPEPARNQTPAQPDQVDNGAKPGKNDPPANGPAGPQMSQQDVLSFLRRRLGDGDPFMNPMREWALKDLRDEILRHGVSFHNTSIGPFANELSKFGALSNVTAALDENYGPPAMRDELFGRWLFTKVGAGSNPRFGNNGPLTINANGTYVWDTGTSVVRGTWRDATPEEMAGVDKGGQGIVLSKGKGGWDWIAARRDEEGPAGKGIKLHNLPDHNLRERGTRG